MNDDFPENYDDATLEQRLQAMDEAQRRFSEAATIVNTLMRGMADMCHQTGTPGDLVVLMLWESVNRSREDIMAGKSKMPVHLAETAVSLIRETYQLHTSKIAPGGTEH